MLRWVELSDDEARRVLDEATHFDRLAALEDIGMRLAVFEAAHGLPTDEMRRLVAADEMPETEEVLAWLTADNRRRAILAQMG